MIDPVRLDASQRVYQKSQRIHNNGLVGLFLGVAMVLFGNELMQQAGQAMLWLTWVPLWYSAWLIRKSRLILEGRE